MSKTEKRLIMYKQWRKHRTNLNIAAAAVGFKGRKSLWVEINVKINK